jgi:hypothetical protein
MTFEGLPNPEAASIKRADDRRRWLILAGAAQLMVVLDATIVNIALPSAQRALGFPADRACGVSS